MGYRRGFKSEANAIAREVREELGLGALDPLDPRQLATHLAVPVHSLSEFAAVAPSAVAHLSTVEPRSFSAVTVFRGSRRVIVHNDAHARGRQNSNLAHELAHALLHHAPTPALDDRGNRLWNQNIEDEATWLAGALLLPEDAAIVVARQRWPVERAAAHFNISHEMVEFRLNVTGARLRVRRMRLS